VEVWTVAEGSGVDKGELSAFGSKAGAAANELHNIVGNLKSALLPMGCSAQGAFANIYNQLSGELDVELKRMSDALRGTADATVATRSVYEQGDSDQVHAMSAVQPSGHTKALLV